MKALTLLNSKKGISFVWLGIIVIIFAMGLWYIILSQPWEIVRETVGTNFTGTAYEPTYKKINMVWSYLLIIFLLCMIMLGVLTAMRKRDYE